MEKNVSHSSDGGQPLRILLVEDNEADIKIAQRAFQQAGSPVDLHIARDGQEALDFLEGLTQSDAWGSGMPHVILLDINMPRMSGLECLRRLKSSETLRSIPAVMLTSSKNEKDVEESYALGAENYIQKPLDYVDFVGVVQDFCLHWRRVVFLKEG